MVLCIESVTIVTLNALTIIIYVKERSLRKRSMYLVINLAVADMFVACSLIVWIYHLGNICNLQRKIRLFHSTNIFTELAIQYFPAVSVTNLTAISWERMHATFRPFRHRVIKKEIFGAAVAAIWFTAGLFTAIVLSPFQFYISWEHAKSAYFSFLLCCLFIILISYTSIATKFYWGTHLQHHGAISREKKLTKTLFIVTVVSLTLLLPRTIFLFLFFVSSGESFGRISYQTWTHLNYSATCLFYANSFINPLLYALKMPEFKRALLLLLRCRSRWEPSQVFPLNGM